MSSGGFLIDRNVVPGTLTPGKLSTDFRKYTYCSFASQGRYTAMNGYGDPTGTAGDDNMATWPAEVGGQLNAIQFVIGTQTILSPSIVAGGLDVSQDLTNNDGFEWGFGIASDNVARGRHVYTVGTHKRFFATLGLKLTDITGTDTLLFGFRKVQAASADYTDYTDYAAFALVAALGALNTKTRNDSGTAVSVATGTTWADLETKALTVEVDGEGNVKFYLDGAELGGASPLAGQTFAFDVGDNVFPFFHMLHDTDVAESTLWTYFEAGYRPVRTI
jgi:hypothetical protein